VEPLGLDYGKEQSVPILSTKQEFNGMAPNATELYASPNGDRWYLVRAPVNQEVCVKHEPNAASGGKPSYIPIGEFLSRGAHGPEHSELLRLIGMLVDSGGAQPSDGTRRYSGQAAVLPASSGNPTTEPFDPVD
jgi:hypothetical protein